MKQTPPCSASIRLYSASVNSIPLRAHPFSRLDDRLDWLERASKQILQYPLLQFSRSECSHLCAYLVIIEISLSIEYKAFHLYPNPLKFLLFPGVPSVGRIFTYRSSSSASLVFLGDAWSRTETPSLSSLTLGWRTNACRREYTRTFAGCSWVVKYPESWVAPLYLECIRVASVAETHALAPLTVHFPASVSSFACFRTHIEHPGAPSFWAFRRVLITRMASALSFSSVILQEEAAVSMIIRAGLNSWAYFFATSPQELPAWVNEKCSNRRFCLIKSGFGFPIPRQSILKYWADSGSEFSSSKYRTLFGSQGFPRNSRPVDNAKAREYETKLFPAPASPASTVKVPLQIISGTSQGAGGSAETDKTLGKSIRLTTGRRGLKLIGFNGCLQSMSESVAWWVLQAQAIQPRSCPHCKSGQTGGRYVTTLDGRGRLVEEFCRTCGWSEPVFSQDTAYLIRDHRDHRELTKRGGTR